MPNLETLEEEVARDRAALAQSLDALTNAANPQRAADHVATMVEGYGGELGRQAWSAARQNPAAFALVGAGIALLLTGAGSRGEQPVKSVPAADDFDARVEAADAAIKAEATGLSEEIPQASQLRAAMETGLNKLPSAARKRVIDARVAALHAQERVEAQAAKISKQSRMFMNDQPLAVGALAAGVGALLGALLPATRREDELLGKKRDALMRAARETLSEELQKVQAQASAKIKEAGHSADSLSRAT